jgi:membrane associated rhomboid family serine protease
MPQRAAEPAINIPPVTLVLIAANVLAFAALRLLSGDAVWRAIDALGFVPGRYAGIVEGGGALLYAPFTYQFLHGDWAHLGINMVTLAAFGAGVERRVGGVSFLSVYLLCGLLAAAAHFAVYPTGIEPLIGASGAISGLMAGALRVLREVRGRAGFAGGGLFGLAVVWAATTVAFGIAGMPGDGGTSIAWVAHLGGFVAGMILFGFFIGSGSRDGRA